MERKVAAVGCGVTRFDVQPDKSWKQLVCQALYEALDDARMDASEIQAGTVGCAAPVAFGQMPIATCVADCTGLNLMGLTHNAEQCTAGLLAIRDAFFAIRSGVYDRVVVIGFEKETDLLDMRKFLDMDMDAEYEAPFGIYSPPLWYKLHNQLHGEPTREQTAMYAVHARKMAKKNPKAYYYDKPEITVEDFLNAPPWSSPLGVLDRTNYYVDGAAVIILTSGEIARKYTDTPVYIEGISQKNDHHYLWMDPNTSLFPALRLAAKEVYGMAKVKPSDIDFACLHDCWAFWALIQLECLGICNDKEGGKFAEEGQMALGGRCPCATDGGVYGRAHPFGATGVASAIEAVTQLRGEAKDRQVGGAEIAVQTQLGYSARSACIWRRY